MPMSDRSNWIAQSGTTVRAGVFGINDGLVSNLGLILGVAGATDNHSIIVLSGIAGMAAGAISMAAGEYISMRSQYEVLEYQSKQKSSELSVDNIGSPWVAAISSLISFAIGAFIPLLPFFFNIGHWSLKISIIVSALSLFIVGCILSLFTGRNAFYGGFRMLCIGAFAGIATYAIGKMVGVNIH